MLEQDRIIKINIEEEMKSSYIDYSMSVIVARALPDVRDGFKPVHRRILYGMIELGNTSDKAYKKSARIVGEVLGKYHPHGDSSVYGALVRMAQDWAMRYPLVDGQGNFGSVDGDSPAAMRYTEARLKKIGEEMMQDLYKETVDFQNNFDDTLQEPTVMPTRIPNLLVNGASGIAVGMATNMPTHNLSEVIDACIAYIDNNDIDIECCSNQLLFGAFDSDKENFFSYDKFLVKINELDIINIFRMLKEYLIRGRLVYSKMHSEIIVQNLIVKLKNMNIE